ncbi:hypothetical protein OEZ86_006318 [Tetradesmus obliquus]|uniref:Prefoldin subunit 1 n=1 Tax=Tetradesmus obliquus TaxID=3088 RepID=A0A383WQ53_TETOB|nr:hypothetical protein OEZ86_006318 [Tetradesmus obliquus]|eukprot:jgi/Sobl393_1/10117/SZX79453.1
MPEEKRQQEDLQPFIELQEKLAMNISFQQAVQQQLQRAMVSTKRSELTLQELSSMSSSVPMYKQVGKAYFMAPMQQVVDELKDDIKGSQDEGKKLLQQKEHADKAIRATEAEMQELMKAHPEAVRHLAALGA